MSPQMQSGEPARSYGVYEGNQTHSQQEYETPYGQPPQGNTYDDNFVEAVAQRLAQRINQGPSGKVQEPSRDKLSAGQRLALSIVSVIMLIPLAGIMMGAVGGFTGLIGFGAGCLAIFLINAVFYEHAHK